MKNFLHTLIATACLLGASACLQSATAQAPTEYNCYYTSPNGCISIGYTSVTPHINQPGEPQGERYDVLITFRACGDVSEIKISQVQGSTITIPSSQITGDIQTVPLVVNASAFKDGELRIRLDFVSGGATNVDIVYTTEEECDQINPLPVELVNFKATTTNTGVGLKWRTASELENKHFEVERSNDGRTFRQIGVVPGHGTTSLPKDYAFEDRRPSDGTNYYRLRQVDFDGKHEFSHIVAVENAPQEDGRLVVVPNPCINGDCQVRLGRGSVKSKTIIQLKDLSGRTVYARTLYPGDDAYVKLDELKQLKGIYLLTATTNDTVLNQRVLME